MSYKIFLRLAVVAIVVWVLVELIHSCGENPTQNQLFTQLTMMRSDMQAVIKSGGQVTDYDDNRKTTFSRVYLILGVSAESWSDSLRRTYTDTLIGRGWHQVKSDESKPIFCKQGVYASLLPPHNEYGASLTMEFDASSTMQCRKLLSGD